MLSKDAKSILYTLYKEYLNRRKLGFSKSFSKSFDSAASIHENFLSSWLFRDVEEALRELGRNGFLNNLYGDGTICYCELYDSAIVIMENQKKETLLSITDFVSKFIP